MSTKARIPVVLATIVDEPSLLETAQVKSTERSMSRKHVKKKMRRWDAGYKTDLQGFLRRISLITGQGDIVV